MTVPAIHKRIFLRYKSLAVAIPTLISRLLGLVRDILIAHFFGEGGVLDAFFIAFKIPNICRRLFIEGAFSQTWVPLLQDKTSAKAYFQVLFSCLFYLSIVLLILGEWGAPFWVSLLAPGFRGDPTQIAWVISLFRILLPFSCCLLFTALFSAQLNSRFHFLLPASSPILLNLTTIIVLMAGVGYAHGGIVYLAWGLVFGGGIQLLCFVPELLKQDLSFRPSIRLLVKANGSALVATLPRALAYCLVPFIFMVDLILLTYLPGGAISILVYAERLLSLPTALIGMGVATVLLPRLVKAYQEHHLNQITVLLRGSFQLILLVGGAAALALYFLALPLSQTLFESGAFSFQNALELANILRIWAFALLPILSLKIGLTAVFAQPKPTAYLFPSLVILILNGGIGYLGLPILGLKGLVGLSVVLIWLYCLYLGRKTGILNAVNGNRRFWWPFFLFCLFFSGVLWGLNYSWFYGPQHWGYSQRWLVLLGYVLIGGGSFFCFLKRLGLWEVLKVGLILEEPSARY